MKKLKNNVLKQLSLLGKSLMIPIVILPIAALIGVIAGSNFLDIPYIANAQSVVFGNIDLLFVFGTVVAYSRSKDKTTVIVAAIMGFLIFKSSVAMINETVNMGVFGGMIYGIVTAVISNYSKDWKVPNMFSFFAGDKMIITLSPIIALTLGFVFGHLWVYPEQWLESLSIWISSFGIFSVFLFIFLQRMLIPTGLHHVLNTYFLFELGTYVAADGAIVKGLIPRFLAGDVEAGLYGPGVYVIFFFGIPAIAYAIYKTAYDENKEEVKGIMTSGALTSVVGGVTEPIEFSFMFASPKLYFIYALLGGLSGALLAAMNVSHGGSKNIIQYILLYPLGHKAWMIIPVGIVFGLIYYFTFKYIIEKDNVETPGRVRKQVEVVEEGAVTDENTKLSHSNYGFMAKQILKSVGGEDNVVSIEHCVTRLRFELKDANIVDKDKILQTGARAAIKISDNDYQIVIGTDVVKVYSELEAMV